jgi:hypothetical protein
VRPFDHMDLAKDSLSRPWSPPEHPFVPDVKRVMFV